jgi:hypothetical protein
VWNGSEFPDDLAARAGVKELAIQVEIEAGGR